MSSMNLAGFYCLVLIYTGWDKSKNGYYEKPSTNYSHEYSNDRPLFVYLLQKN